MQDMRDEAIAALRDALRSTRTADRLRAAEAILRATGDAKSSARDAGLAELSDQALLEIARGVHHREMGPVTPSAETVPSRAHTEQSSRFANPEYTAAKPEYAARTGGSDSLSKATQTAICEAADALQRLGPKKDPANTNRWGGVPAKGTQNGPAIPETPPPGLVTPDNPFMKRRQKGPKEDPRNVMPGAPSPSEPEPWE